MDSKRGSSWHKRAAGSGGMGASTILRWGGALVLGASVLFVVLAFNLETTEFKGVPGSQPGLPTTRQGRRPNRSPAPAVKPGGKLAYLDWLGDEYNLRQCQCRKDWKSQPEGTSVCKCGGKDCAASITPPYLTEGKGQGLCSLEEHQGFNCNTECIPSDSAVAGKEPLKWFAAPCGGTKQPDCDPMILSYRVEARKEKERRAKEEVLKAEEEKKIASIPKFDWDPNEVYDLRGLQCEIYTDGKERCFMEDEQGRELCPPGVTHETLGFPEGQYLCSADMAKQYYCTVTCQDGSPVASWGAHEISWCFDPKNIGSCPERARPPLKKDYVLKQWSAEVEVETPCEAAHRLGERPDRITQLTIGLLTHESRAFAESMKTYEALGLFDVVGEFLIYMNKRRPEMEAVAQIYVDKHPDIVRVLGDSENYGILRPMNWLTGNSSNEYFMFLERDFQLILPAACVAEQFNTGIDLIKEGTAHVVRYRHRKKAGRPNWAARMFRGHEDDVFKNGQPNLFCNSYYWVKEPEKRWPDKMWICHKDPVMYCSDSFYCNWTNNPQLWHVPWWNKEYVSQFAHFTRNDPWYDVEVYMNWEPNSWNDRKWIVAQGDGLFKHSDRAKWG